jgi:hypothetical protein
MKTHPAIRQAAFLLSLASIAAGAQQLHDHDDDPYGPVTIPAGAIPLTAGPGQSQIMAGKRALAAKQFLEAKRIFSDELKLHPQSTEAKLGLADSELGLDHYEVAETEYREVVAAKPELWQAHKNLVIVEAALGRWEDFDRERTVLRMARERNAPGISARESDVIDSFTIRGQRWIVREYFEPVGRSQTRYNFEHFSTEGKAQEYISLDSAALPTAAGAVAIGDHPSSPATAAHFALNRLNGKSHGTIKTYGSQEPPYEHMRADVQRWLRQQK